MNRLWIRAAAAILMLFSLSCAILAPKAETVSDTGAAAMALIEAETGCVLAEQNKDVPLPMASTTKIMTALIVLENSDIGETAATPDEAVGTEGSSIHLAKNERMSVIDLLYGLMLASGNDAAVALAVHTAGSVSAFVDMMNARAAELGLEKTHFVTPNGLHDREHYTTAYELCLIAREALKNETFRTIVSTKYYTASSGDRPRTFKNKNSLLWTCRGAFGVKTGYTSAAGRCLVFGAERDGMTVIGVVLNCRPMFETASKLLDAAFEEYTVETIVRAGEAQKPVIIENGAEKLLEVETKHSIISVMRRSSRKQFRIETVIFEGVSAPVERGETVGELRVYDGCTLVGSTDLIASRDMRERDFLFWWRLLLPFFAA